MRKLDDKCSFMKNAMFSANCVIIYMRKKRLHPFPKEGARLYTCNENHQGSLKKKLIYRKTRSLRLIPRECRPDLTCKEIPPVNPA